MIQYNRHRNRVYEGGFSGDMRNGFLRDGRGYILDESGRMKQVYVYENGRRKRVIMTVSGDTMTEYDLNGEKVYEGGFKEDGKGGFVRNGYGYRLNGKTRQYCIY